MYYVSRRLVIGNVCKTLFTVVPGNHVRYINEIIDSISKAFYNILPDEDKKRCDEESGIYSVMDFDFETSEKFDEWLRIALFNSKKFTALISDEFTVLDLNRASKKIVQDIWDDHVQEKDCYLCKYATEFGSSEYGSDLRCLFCTNNCSEDSRVGSYFEPHPYSLLRENSEEYKELIKKGIIKKEYDIR